MGAKVDTSFSSLRFPDYLGTNEAPAYIRFEPFEMDFGQFKNSSPTGAGIVAGTEDNAKNSTFDKLKGNIFDKTKDFADKKAKGFLGGKLNIGKFEIDFDKEKDVLKSNGSINLFLPEGLSSQVGLTYDGTTSGVGAAGAAAGIFQDVLKGEISSVASAANKVGAGGIAGIVKSVANTNTARVISGVGGGVVANNVTFQLFKGVGYRSFTYNFNLIAKNPKESVEIKRICDTMIFYSLPSRSVEDFEAKDQKGIFHFYDVPAMWKIGYYYKDAVIPYLQQPNTYCVLTDIDVQYPNNQVYSDGAPLQVDLTLSFREIEPMYRKSDDRKHDEAGSVAGSIESYSDKDGNFVGP